MESLTTPIKGAKILCTNIPEEFLSKNTAKIHFSQYGRITRIFIKLRSRICVVEYEHRQYAKRAIVHGGQYKGQKFDVKWYPKFPLKKKRVRKAIDPEWLPDLEIQNELNAMAAFGDAYAHKYNLRTDTPEDLPVKKPPVQLKKNIWKSKPKSIISSESLNAWTSEQLELLKTLKQQAFTMEEKYKVLEARDKLIRFRTRKSIDITKASPTVGTCPDMCPEKERLMRVVQHQVALYEQDTNEKTMNPAIAIKQYSRSSADQETPLPHELRPVSVLQLTMGYLMHSIMHLCDTSDVNLAEWYHFLWDRTRSIRKDITQQELCSRGSVELMEQCTRFHIHCSARLVAEETSVFDQKINTENLTKCLQTLKYMYQDLHLKGESCPNEAEFRAYIILLNLNDGNFMWEVQQLKLEVQRSKEIKFALEIYSAIDQNNFVKFFKLVYSTGYLNACVLMRYFIQVRSRALSTILKCYSSRTPYNQFAIAELQNLLAFEDTESTIEFIVAHGLYLTPDEAQVVLDKKNYQLPEIPLLLDRAINIVESKKKLSVGEVVCGGALPLPLYQNYVPHDSFNEKGYLIINDILFDIIRDSQMEVTIDEPDTVAKMDNLPNAPSSLARNVNIFSSKTNPAFSEQTTDPSLPFWTIKTDPKTAATNIFGIKSESCSDIFNVQQPTVDPFKQNIFPPDNWKPSEKSKSIFGGSGEQPEQTKNIFGNEQLLIKPTFTDDGQRSKNIFAQQLPSDFPFTTPTFGEQSSDAFSFANQRQPEQQKSGAFGEQSFAFMNQKPSSERSRGIFGEEAKPNIFAMPTIQTGTGQSSAGGQPETIFGGSFQSRQPNSSMFGRRQVNIFGGGAKFVGEDEDAASVVDPNLSDILGKDVEMATNDNFGVASIKSPDLNRQNIEKLEQERLSNLEKERQHKLEMEAMEKKLKEEERRRRLEEEKRKEAENLRRIEEVKRKAVLEEKNRKIDLEIKELVATVMNELLDKVEKLQEEQRLGELATSIKKSKISIFVQKWRRRIDINKRKRHAMDQNPIWLPSRSVDDEARELFAHTQNLTLQNVKRYKFGRSFDVTPPQKLQTEKIDLPSVYRTLVGSYSKIYTRSQKEIFWKVTVSLPDYRELRVGLNVVENVLTEFFNWKDRYGSTAIVDQYKANKLFSYCIEKKRGILPAECNSNGLLFISHEPTELLRQRITSSLKNFPLSARLPIAVILINNNATSLNTLPLGKTLEADGRIGNYDILACKFTNTALINAIKQSLDFLVKFIEKTPPLELNMLNSFIYTNLATELWRRITGYAVWNSKYKACLKSPFLLIDLYNVGIDKLKEIVLDKSSLAFLNFPDEFDKFLINKVPDVFPCDYRYFPTFWKSDSYRTLLAETLNSLRLPQYAGEWPPKSEFELEKDIYMYSSKISKRPKQVFYKVMAKLLKNVDPVENFRTIENIYWIDAVQVLALEKLQEIDFSLHHTEFYSKSIFEQLFVIYNVKSLEAFRSDEWFYLNHPLVKAEIQKNLEKSRWKTRIWEPPVDDLNDIDLDQIERDVRKVDIKKEDELNCKKSKMMELESFINELQETMEIQKKINSVFHKTVVTALDISK